MGNRSGLILLEILVALSVAAFLALSGGRLLVLLLDQLEGQGRADVERIQQMQWETRLQRFWDQRSCNLFQEGPWLKIEGSPAGNGIILKRFRMRTMTPSNDLAWLEVSRNPHRWQVAVFRDSKEDEEEVSELEYTGKIIIEAPAGSFSPGDEPSFINWRFPDADTRDRQVGFAFRKLW